MAAECVQHKHQKSFEKSRRDYIKSQSQWAARKPKSSVHRSSKQNKKTTCKAQHNSVSNFKADEEGTSQVLEKVCCVIISQERGSRKKKYLAVTSERRHRVEPSKSAREETKINPKRYAQELAKRSLEKEPRFFQGILARSQDLDLGGGDSR